MKNIYINRKKCLPVAQLFSFHLQQEKTLAFVSTDLEHCYSFISFIIRGISKHSAHVFWADSKNNWQVPHYFWIEKGGCTLSSEMHS